MNYYSQIGQDKLILKYLNNKKNGFFLDIGCGYPKHINNTFILEKEYDWNGISIDLIDYIEPNSETWEGTRKTHHVLHDALNLNYLELLKEKNAPFVIDYLSMDLEPPDLTFQCLYKIPFDQYQFNFISFETDEGREGGDHRRDVSREYFKSMDYIYIGSLGGQDDFYLHNSLSDLTKTINFHE
jgi:hypothetical protein